MTNEPYLVTTKLHMSYVIELHALCFGSDEQAKLTPVLLDENCFTILGGNDKNGQPTGYSVVRVQGKEAHGLWSGIRPERRGEGRYSKIQLAAINESRTRGAEIWDAYISGDNDTSNRTLRVHENLGFTLVRTFTDTYINDDGERVEFVNHHFRKSLMSIANRNDYDKKIFTCDGEGTHPKVFFQYTPKISNVRELVDGRLTAVCPQCDRDVIHNG